MPHAATSRRDLARGFAALALGAPVALAAGRAAAQPGGSPEAAVNAAYQKYRTLNEGKNADYIPALAKVPSNYFGIAVVTPQGKVATAGDIEPKFSIQSISKVFTMALVFQESGENLVEESIGVDATGQVFNSITAVEQYRGKEMNPLVNPGAIATTGMVKGSPDEVWKKILAIHSDFAGRQLDVDQEVYKSEADIIQVPTQRAEAVPPGVKWGGFEPGKGVILARGDFGEVDLGLVSYLRYLNQHGLDKTYTSAFGQPFDVTPREDFQLAKVQITLRGWLFDPRFGYNAYVWTSQVSQGEDAQVVAAGNINWTFSDALRVYFGIHSLPSTRSTNRTFPYWLRNDNRPIADEYFRGSYTQGIWAEGRIARGLEYRVMVANNLSALGVSARQLDAKPNTWSGAITWMPTTGEFGPGNAFGDFEEHQKLATLFSAHYSRSTETPQSQPDTDSIENTQLRLSDGTLLFNATAFRTGRITEARYQMVALNAAAKYKGYSLEFEYYMRWLDNFAVEGVVPFTHTYDSGFQLQAAAMVIPKTLQLYVSGSKIYGEVGNPYDVAVGLNYFPLQRRDLRLNVMGLWVRNSPVGYTAYPIPVGGNGFTLVTDFSLAF